MAIVKIVGKPKMISTQELRAMCVASASVMEFHNRILHDSKNEFIVKVVDTEYIGKSDSTVGDADREKRVIRVVARLDSQQMFTTIVHEVVHLYLPIEDWCNEKCTSTLVNRLKPDVAKIYEHLIDGMYKRAGFIAHTAIAYRPAGKDFYDQSQFDEVPLSDRGKKYRRASKV